MEAVSIEALMQNMGVEFATVMYVAALVFATTALVKKRFSKVSGSMVLIVSGVSSVVWTLLLMMGDDTILWRQMFATMLLAFITASGGWQTFKDILQKGSENVTWGSKPHKPLGAGDRLSDK